jgi:hypothetical protein
VVALLVIVALAVMAVMAVLATSWGADRADAVFGQDGAGIERDVLLSEFPLLLLSEDGAYGMVVRHAMLCATAVVALAVPIRTMAVVAVFTASGLRSNGADAVFGNHSLGVHRSARLLVVVTVAVFRSAGVVGAVTAVTSLRVATVVASWSLRLSQIDAADAIVRNDCLGVSKSIIFEIFVATSRSKRAG